MRKSVGVILALAVIAAAIVAVSPVAAQQQRASGGAVTSFYDLKTMALVDAAYKSAAEHRAVPLAEFTVLPE